MWRLRDGKKKKKTKRGGVGNLRIKWENLTTGNATKLAQKIKADGAWDLGEEARKMWRVWSMAACIQSSAEEILRVVRLGSRKIKGVWWWNDEVKGKVKEKQEAYRALMDSVFAEAKEANRAKYI